MRDPFGRDMVNEEPDELQQLDWQIDELRKKRKELVQNQRKQLPPIIAVLLDQAFELGQQAGTNLHLISKARDQEKRIKHLEDVEDDNRELATMRDHYKTRAEKAEETIKRSRAARRKR